MFLKDYEGDVSDLGLDFTVANNDFGETQVSCQLTLHMNICGDALALWQSVELAIKRLLLLLQSAACALLHNNLRQVVHTFVPLSPSNISWYQCKNLEGNGRSWKRYGLPFITLSISSLSA